MVTTIQKWGNSQGLRFPKAVLQDVQIEVGDEVAISTRGRTIIIEPVKSVRGQYDLKKLVAAIPKNYRAKELDSGLPVGKEVW